MNKGIIKYDPNIAPAMLKHITEMFGSEYVLIPNDVDFVYSGDHEYYKKREAVDLAIKFIGARGSSPQHPLIETARSIYEFMTEKSEDGE